MKFLLKTVQPSVLTALNSPISRDTPEEEISTIDNSWLGQLEADLRVCHL